METTVGRFLDKRAFAVLKHDRIPNFPILAVEIAMPQNLAQPLLVPDNKDTLRFVRDD